MNVKINLSSKECSVKNFIYNIIIRQTSIIQIFNFFYWNMQVMLKNIIKSLVRKNIDRSEYEYWQYFM